MKWLGYPIYRLLAVYVIGLVIGYYIDFSLKFICIAIVVAFIFSLGFIGFSRRHVIARFFFSISVLLFFGTLGTLNMVIKNPIFQEDHFENHITAGKEQLITITLTNQLHPNAYNNRFYGEVSSLDHRDVKGKALILFKRSDSINYILGNQLTIYDDISKASDERNPGDFNYKEYLELIDVHGQIYVDSHQVLQSSFIENQSWIVNMRNYVMSSLEHSGLHARQLGIVQALILGQRNNVDPAVTQSFRDAGVIHILALSGLHVGIILLILKRLTNWLKQMKYGNWIQSVVLIILLWIFALLTGMSPSILRAVTMFSFIAVGMNVNRKTSILHSLALSAMVLLLINPKLILHVGFQLSYTAVIAILLIQPIIYNLFRRPKWKAIDYLWQIFSVTLAAQIGVAPLSLFYFHQFPGLFLLGNMLLLPVLPLIIGLSITLVVFLIADIPSVWIVKLLNISLEWIIKTVEGISSLDQFIVKNVYLDLVELVFIYVILLALALFFLKSVRKSRRERALQKRPGYNLHIALVAIIAFIGFQSFKKLEFSETRAVLMHQAAGSVISISNADHVQLYIDFHAMDSVRYQSSLERIKASSLHRAKVIKVDSLYNKVSLNNTDLIIVDESTIILPDYTANLVLLSHSPQIHLDKVISNLQPKIIIADGSNYRTYVTRWKATCEKRGVRFLSTYEEGAINLNSLAAGIQN